MFTLVTTPVVAYTHLNGRVSQTTNPKVIGSLHTPRMGGKCGEVNLVVLSMMIREIPRWDHALVLYYLMRHPFEPHEYLFTS